MYLKVFFLCLLIVLIPFRSAASAVDYGPWATLLAKHVRDGVVDYKGFKADQTKLEAFLEELGKVDATSLSPKAQMAYYINVYNAWTIKLMLDNYGVKSIRDIGSLLKSPWKIRLVRLKNETVTLDYVEHDVLRPRFKDPRVHAAVNCASKSCPKLQSVPFDEGNLDALLDAASAAWINDPAMNRLDGTVLRISAIFDWFKEDFTPSPKDFMLRFAKPDLKAAILAAGDKLAVKHLDYDWSLNGTW